MNRDQRWCLFMFNVYQSPSLPSISMPLDPTLDTTRGGYPPLSAFFSHSTTRGGPHPHLALDYKGRSLSPSRTRHGERKSSPLSPFSRTQHEGRSFSLLVSSHTTRQDISLSACYYEKGKRHKDEGSRGCPPILIYLHYIFLFNIFFSIESRGLGQSQARPGQSPLVGLGSRFFEA